MLARSLHLKGERARHPLIELDCRRLPSADLADVFLVGREVRVISGGMHVVRGVCEKAGLGTLILAEIAALPMTAQQRLARVMREGQLRAIGAGRAQPFLAHVIATTTCEPDELARRVDPELLRAFAERRRLAPLREQPEEVERLIPKQLAPPLRARLARLSWHDNYYDFDRLHPTPTEEQVLECELRDAIASAPHDDATRAVYADFCEERRQPTYEEHIRGALSVAEKLDERPARIGRAEPPIEVVHVAHGVVDRVVTAPNRIVRLEQLFRLAPALRELVLLGDRAPHDWPHLFGRRYVKRLRTLRVAARPEEHVVIRAAADMAGVSVELA